MKNDLSSLRVAIVCDWLTGIGGAERVVLELHKMFPNAPIYTSQYDKQALPWFDNADVRTSWLQKIPKSLKKFLPMLRAWSFSRLDLSSFDLVISSSGAEAKGIKAGKETIHINYCHAPTHYYWSRYEQYLSDPGFGILDPLAKLGLRLLVGPMRRWDYKAAQRPDFIVANSTHTKTEIKKYYGRSSEVIHPPVDIERFQPVSSAPDGRNGFVIAGRQIPYKKFDLAVLACTELSLPLKVIGNGPDHEKLKALAGPTINFLPDVSDAEMPVHFQSATAFIFPVLDDFGITAVEAMAAGTPVIAYEAGGALDYVVEGVSGLFFEDQNTQSLVKVLKTFTPHLFNAKIISAKANEFNSNTFTTNLYRHISKVMIK